MEKNTSKAFVESTGPLASALAPTGETGTPLFLINLCASMAPVQLASKALPGLESYRLYQVTRVEDGRTRYRLRLGFFATEAEAEEVLVKVREQYPTAFTACLCEEDKRHTRGYVVPASAAKPQISVVPTPDSALKSAEPATKKAATAQPAQAKAAAKPAQAQVAPTPSKPAVPAAPSKIQVTKIEATSEPEKKTAPAPTAPAKMQSINEITSIDDLSWEAPELNTTPGTAASTASTQKTSTIAPGYKTQPVIKAEPKAKTAPAQPQKPEPKVAKVDTAASMKVKALDLTLSDPPPPAPQTSRPSDQPFHVGKGVDIPTTQLSLQADSAKPAVAAKAAAPAKPGQAPSMPARSTATPAKAATPPATAARQTVATPAAKPAMPAASPAAFVKHPDLDSTQTIRALTAEELREEGQEKWFAIQLAASEQPVNLDAMPHLDIFEAYRLYSVATAGSGKIIHSLRLGFFKEEVSAEAVAGYLKTFFSSPTVLRISVAEQARFKDATLPKKPEPSESKPQATIVELNAARTSRAAAVPTVTMEVVPGPDTSATGSFKLNSTGSFRTSDTAKHRTLPPAAKPAAKSAAPATKRSAPMSSRKKTSTSGKYKSLPKKSLAEELLEEAKEVELSESGIFRMQKNDSSLLARLVDKLKK